MTMGNKSHYQDPSEVHVRYVILQLYWGCRITTLVIVEAPEEEGRVHPPALVAACCCQHRSRNPYSQDSGHIVDAGQKQQLCSRGHNKVGT